MVSQSMARSHDAIGYTDYSSKHRQPCSEVILSLFQKHQKKKLYIHDTKLKGQVYKRYNPYLVTWTARSAPHGEQADK